MREREGLAPFAARGATWERRLIDEPAPTSRSAFQRDRDRIIHSTAFRRLKHKTQVFVSHEGDHYRTRLTHSIEVAQIARSLARTLGLDEDLTETLALAHDLGHTPFGHAGEDALDACMTGFGGFRHNAHTLRIVTRLEQRYAEFDGLNLTFAAIDGLLKHNGPLDGEQPFGIPELVDAYNIAPGAYGVLEAQIAALSDDIAYNNHDIDDGLRAGLFTVDQLLGVPLVGGVFSAVMDRYPALEERRLIHESVRRLIGTMIADVAQETAARLAGLAPRSPDDIAGAGAPVAAFSAPMWAHLLDIREFLYSHMYRHHRVNRMMSKAKRVVTELFELYVNEPQLLPPEVAPGKPEPRGVDTARRVADFIAGMTDTFALAEHQRLFDPQTRI